MCPNAVIQSVELFFLPSFRSVNIKAKSNTKQELCFLMGV